MSGYKQWNSTLKRHTPLRSKSRINPRNDERAERERNRAYGPPERRRMVRRMACLIDGCYRQAENAHLRTKGMGIKEDADQIVPLCSHHHTIRDDSLHKLGSVERFNEVHGVDLDAWAEKVERKWRERENP